MHRLNVFFAVVASLAILVSSSGPSLAQGKKVAVLVGVEDYEHVKLRTPRLKFSVDDATAMSAMLKRYGYEVTLLTDDTAKSNATLSPTRANIEKQIKAVLRKCGRADTFILALAGHGLKFAGDKDAYFCPVDARPFKRDVDTLVAMSGVYRDMDRSIAGVKLILVDACRFDLFFDRERGLDADAAPPPPKGVAALFSCSAGQKAFEHDDLGHGVFFHHVLEGLGGKAADKRGNITFLSLATHVQRSAPTTMTRLFGGRIRQQPKMKADLVGRLPLLAQVTSTPLPTPTQKPKAGEAITNSIGMKLVLIPAGEFLMGSGKSREEIARLFESEAKYYDREHPRHRVIISQPFYLQTTEVTQGQWESVMETTPWRGKLCAKEGGDYAATYVNWEDTQEFIKRLSAKERVQYRLPTEAEWEYACRAGTTTMYSFGDSADQLGRYAWFDDNADLVDEEYAHRVGLKKPNAFGLYDMHGNVSEWCEDWYDGSYYGRSPSDDPVNVTVALFRVLRGGDWFKSAKYGRSADRGWSTPDDRNFWPGFRLARSSGD